MCVPPSRVGSKGRLAPGTVAESTPCSSSSSDHGQCAHFELRLAVSLLFDVFRDFLVTHAAHRHRGDDSGVSFWHRSRGLIMGTQGLNATPCLNQTGAVTDVIMDVSCVAGMSGRGHQWTLGIE